MKQELFGNLAYIQVLCPGNLTGHLGLTGFFAEFGLHPYHFYRQSVAGKHGLIWTVPTLEFGVTAFIFT